MKSLLPLIVVILLLTGAITYTLSRNSIPKVVTKQDSVSPNELEVDSFMTPTPTPTVVSVAKTTPTPTLKATPTVKTGEGLASKPVDLIPTITIKKSQTEGSEGEAIDKTAAEVTTKVTKTNVCTPVYGMADSCVEHIAVDTAGEDTLFLNLAGFSYLAGLAAFVKAKRA
jgi:hypothetical protein